MPRMLLKNVLLWIISIMMIACGFHPVPLIPRSVLFGNPERVQPQISPDGRWISFLAPYQNVLNIWIQPRDGGEARVVTRFQDRGPQGYGWAQDSRHFLFLKDHQGDENTHLYRVRIEDGDISDLTPFAGARAQILAVEKTKPETWLITLNRDNPKYEDAYRLNWKTGDLELAAKNDGRVSQWIADADLQIRAQLTAGENGKFILNVRDSEKAPWRVLLEWGFEDNLNSHVVGFSKDGQALYLVDSRNFSSGRLVKMNLQAGEPEVIAEDARYDVTDVMMHPDRREPQAVEWIQDKKVRRILDADLREEFQTLEARYGTNLAVIDRDNQDQVWILRVESDTAPVSYFVYDRSIKQTRFLFDHQPALKKYKLAAMKPFSFQARDGLTVHGYLTFPLNRKRQNLPLVLKVHGGPWNRDVWGYDARVQWLANRGYLCMQVNFRGSTTYGKAFLNAGNKEWGGKMQDDLSDAVNWAVKQGYADPKRMAIFGGSYGGYAALAAAAFTPDVFQAAVAVVGPSNLMTFLKTTPAYWATELENIYARVGHPEKDSEFLKSRSPLFSADKIKIPVLIAQGANDPRVKKNESDQIAAALRARGVPHEYLLFEDEGHGFAKPENQMRFFKIAERFLARYLGGKFEP